MNKLGLAALLASLVSGIALADTVVLDTGATLEGEVEQLADGVRISFPTGWSAEIPQESIRSLILEDGDQAPAPTLQRCLVLEAPTPQPTRVRRPRPHLQAKPETTQLASSIQASFQRGWRGQGERLVDQHQAAYRWDELEGKASLACAYDGRRMKVSLDRQDSVREDLVVVFSPGTYGTERDGQHYQDLVFLRAPVVVIPAGQRTAEVEIPVACGRYGWATPRRTQPYALDRFEADSDMALLLVELCAGPEAGSEAASQLAVWAVRNRLSQSQFEERHTTFENAVPIMRSSGSRAAELIERSGVDPSAYPFFRQPVQDAPSAAPEVTPSESPTQRGSRRPRLSS